METPTRSTEARRSRSPRRPTGRRSRRAAGRGTPRTREGMPSVLTSTPATPTTMVQKVDMGHPLPEPPQRRRPRTRAPTTTRPMRAKPAQPRNAPRPWAVITAYQVLSSIRPTSAWLALRISPSSPARGRSPSRPPDSGRRALCDRAILVADGGEIRVPAPLRPSPSFIASPELAEHRVVADAAELEAHDAVRAGRREGLDGELGVLGVTCAWNWKSPSGSKTAKPWVMSLGRAETRPACRPSRWRAAARRRTADPRRSPPAWPGPRSRRTARGRS